MSRWNRPQSHDRAKLRGAKATTLEALREELAAGERAALQNALRHLHMTFGFMPRYRPDIMSEEDFEARQAELPLAVVWNEYATAEGTAYSLSINVSRVEDAIATQIPRDHCLFVELRNILHADVKSIISGTLHSTAEKTGATPSVICQTLNPEPS